MADKYIIIEGNPIDGFEFTGPFDSQIEAADFGNTDPHLGDWWIGAVHPIESPKNLETELHSIREKEANV